MYMYSRHSDNEEFKTFTNLFSHYYLEKTSPASQLKAKTAKDFIRILKAMKSDFLSMPLLSLALLLLLDRSSAFVPNAVGSFQRNLQHDSSRNENAESSPCPLLSNPEDPSAAFEAAMGWFWGPQRDFGQVNVAGILDTVVGYSGSRDPKARPNPTYKNIQDYAESIRVTFDPAKISYQDMLDMFFSFHTPADPRFAGSQYRSAIFYFNDEQKELAVKAFEVRGSLGRFVAVEPASDFYQAEDYHQNYIEKQTQSMFMSDTAHEI